jgi:predicted thioesterase
MPLKKSSHERFIIDAEKFNHKVKQKADSHAEPKP